MSPKSRFFINHIIFCVVLISAIVLASRLFPSKLYDELAVLFLPPMIIAAVHHNRFFYLLITFITFLFCSLLLYLILDNPDKNILTAFVVFVMVACAQEVIYWSVRKQRIIEKQKDEMREELEATLKKFKELCEVLPICSMCNKLRTDEKIWNEFESLLSKKLDVDLVKGICEDCTSSLVSDLSQSNESDEDYDVLLPK